MHKADISIILKKKIFSHLLIIFFLALSFSGFSQKIFFISPAGNDLENGSLQHPFKTVEGAQHAIEKVTGKVIVYLREGNYFLIKPIVFTAKDSRMDNEEIIYQSYKKEKVVFSSARPQKVKWQVYKAPVLITEIDGSVNWDQLFVDGELQRMARYPNFDPEAKIYGGTDSNSTSAKRVMSWQNPEGGYLHVMHKSEWGDFHFVIKGKDDNGNLKLDGGGQNNRQTGLHKTQRFVENIFEELDIANEWYADKKNGKLYYYPPKKFSRVTSIIQSPQLENLIEFKGTAGHPVKNIRLEGIIFTHTLRTFMKTREPLLRSDWTIYRGGTVLLEGTENCVISKCTFKDNGGNAIFFSGYNRSDSVRSCLFKNIGASAICFVGNPSAVRSSLFEYHQSLPLALIDRTPGPQNNSYPFNCVAYDNLIHDIGLIEKQVAGIQISMSQNITVSHNSVYNTPRAGININDGTWGGNVIEFNDVFNTVLETGDHGSFNSWGRDRYWNPVRDTMNEYLKLTGNKLVLLDAVQTNIIRNNRFRCDHGWDIDLDDGSSNYYIYNNLLLNGGLKLREGFYRVAENNIIINNSFHPHVWFNNSEDIFRKNIVTTGYYPIRILDWGKEVDHNIFLDSTGLQQAQKDGHDNHSVFAENGLKRVGDQYIFTNSSIKKEVGFMPFDQNNFGVVSKNLKAIAAKPVLPELINAILKNDARQFEVFGLIIKNVFAGERSATGIDSEHGIYISEVQKSSPFFGLLKPNDVLLMMNNKEIDIKDLLQQKNVLRFNKAIKFQIFRDQHLQELLWEPK